MPADPRTRLDPVTPEAIRQGFTPRRLARKIIYAESTGSTNGLLKQASARGAAEGTVVVAEEQTAGRGRLNRQWSSPPGVGVYLSILLRPEGVAVPPFVFTFLPAVATARALRSVSGLPVFIKWPNDLTLRGKKVAGILSEIRSAGQRVREVVVGIGVNVNHTPADLPGALQDTATSLALAAGRGFSRAKVVQALLSEMDSAYAALDTGRAGDLLEMWKRLSPSHYGKPVVVSGGAGGPVRGVTRSIDHDGALLVERADGGLERILFGEVRRVSRA